MHPQTLLRTTIQVLLFHESERGRIRQREKLKCDDLATKASAHLIGALLIVGPSEKSHLGERSPGL